MKKTGQPVNREELFEAWRDTCPYNITFGEMFGEFLTKEGLILAPKDTNSELTPKDIRTTDFSLDEDHGA